MRHKQNLRKTILIGFCFFIVSPFINLDATAKDRIQGPIPARIDRVIDGDTIHVIAKIWLEQNLEISVRIADIDAPELFRPKCEDEKSLARKAKIYAENFFNNGEVYLHDIQSGKYAGRVVARLTNSAGTDFGAALIKANLAFPSTKRTRSKKGKWCQVK